MADQQQWVNLGNNQWIQTGIGQGRWVQVNGQWIRVWRKVNNRDQRTYLLKSNHTFKDTLTIKINEKYLCCTQKGAEMMDRWFMNPSDIIIWMHSRFLLWVWWVWSVDTCGRWSEQQQPILLVHWVRHYFLFAALLSSNHNILINISDNQAVISDTAENVRLDNYDANDGVEEQLKYCLVSESELVVVWYCHCCC